MKFLGSLATAAAVIGGYAIVVRPRLLRSGATPDEVADRGPGADLVPEGAWGSTMAVTIDAPPKRVWPWLVQMGYGRAGWYSWDRLDHQGIPSADRIHPEWQNVSVGDRLTQRPDDKNWFEVVALEAPRFMALGTCLDLHGRQVPLNEARPAAFTDLVWSFSLTELSGERTRLVVNTYCTGRPWIVNAAALFFFWEPAHWVMQKKQFANLKRRAEADTDTVSQPPADARARA